ncbi:xanthine dehydrogenase family protein molybdopterin-binding subunit [Halomonas nitroreducens]|uniref:Xanthine dehydrogenase family protein molybdopterin-binding subunit n=1 Tax=Halomonas nitroreducens TaxID=447425 RepID=A0A431V819_9GAMM|nr:xanthine dehydrogenase family protein molybdopterin-binding subunit [Halomonas nitroreducens]RTR06545.1 xanthine dehydrogenase family protein molybdopterin-binding subunit [Halomonas nitroreducens]
MSDITEPRVIGRRTPRIDGVAKLTGRADYTVDHRLEGMLHGYPVPASIAHGTLESLTLDAARAMPGVVDILHHGHFPDLHRSPNSMRQGNAVSEVRLPFEDDRIHYHGQYIALVIAETFAQARAAAFRVEARYHRDAGVMTGLAASDDEGEEVRHYTRGEPELAFGIAPVILDETYTMAAESHLQLESHATLAEWHEADQRLIVHESTQGVFYQRNALARIFDLPEERVEVISHYIGSGFGNKLFMWPHAVATAAAARMLGRPVKTVLPRQQDMMTTGHRPASRQRIRLGAELDGSLASIQHDSLTETSTVDRYVDACGGATPSAYACDSVATHQRILPVHHGTPCPMRAPGEVSGVFALESAMDELALALDMDPLALRLKNYAHQDPQRGLPWSSKHLDRCLESAAERFGWTARDPGLGAMRDGDEVIGQGMAAATWFAGRQPCAAEVELRADGSVVAACGTQDIGTGTYTIVAQTVAELTGVPIERVEVRLGETHLPAGPLSGGSMTTASTLPAVAAAVHDALTALKARATEPGGSFAGLAADSLGVESGALVADGRRADFAEILARHRLTAITGEGSAAPGDERREYSFRSFGAHFVEVRWDPGISRLRVARVVSSIDIGRAINPVAARNQVEGAIVMGIGMALLEKLDYDPRDARLINANASDYRIPVHADMPEIDVELLDHPDFRFNEFGARGIGEIGLTGIAPAIANAVHHATGKRLRNLPITVEQLVEGN